jgi:rubrerythrin
MDSPEIKAWRDFLVTAQEIFNKLNNKKALLSINPVELEKSQNLDAEILRLSIISEIDAISLYEQLAAKTSNPEIAKILLDVAKEEKTHVGEFQALLLKVDPEQLDELFKGKEEVDKKGPDYGKSESTGDRTDVTGGK